MATLTTIRKLIRNRASLIYVSTRRPRQYYHSILLQTTSGARDPRERCSSVGTPGEPGVRSRLTNEHNYTGRGCIIASPRGPPTFSPASSTTEWRTEMNDPDSCADRESI